jgi:hypothetical protein
MNPGWPGQPQPSRLESLTLFSAAIRHLREHRHAGHGEAGLTTWELYQALLLRSASGYLHARTLFSEGDLAVALQRHQPEVNGGQLRREGHGPHARWSWHEDLGRDPAAGRSAAPHRPHDQPHDQHHRPPPPTSHHRDPPLHTPGVAANLQPDHGQQPPAAAPPGAPRSPWWLVFSDSEQARQAASEQITTSDRAGLPVDPQLRGVAPGEQPANQPWPPALRLDGFVQVPPGDEDLDIGHDL